MSAEETSSTQPKVAGPFSSWVEAVSSFQGRFTVAVGAVSALVKALDEFTSSFRQHPWIGWIATVMLVSCALRYLYDVYQRKQQALPISTAVFVGARPLTDADSAKGRFFGREREIEDLVLRLSAPKLRYIVVSGETGCGKTSLLQAGVIPALERAGQSHCLYLRFFDNPVRELHEALRAIASEATTEPASEPSDANQSPAPSLIDDLRAAVKAAGKTLILFIDQFEEFHVNPISETDYRAILEMIWHIIGKNATIDAKVVFCLRYDFLYLMSVFEDPEHLDNIFDSREARMHLEPLTAVTARLVIESSLSRASVSWEPALVRKVLDDLIIRRLVSGSYVQTVLPTELQIVCQMIQAQSIRSAGEYRGKRLLVATYVEGAIRSAPGDHALARQVLLSLIDENGITRAKPQTLDQIAARLNTGNRRWLRHVLDYLDKNRHIVNLKIPSKTERVAGYELAHDYLVRIIRETCGHELRGTTRSHAILAACRQQMEYDPSFRIPIVDCWRVWRYPPDSLTNDDRSAIRRSLFSFVLRAAPLLILLASVIAVRFGTTTLERNGPFLSLTKGARLLGPVFGNEDVVSWVDWTGRSSWTDFSDEEPQCKFKTWWTPDFLSFVNPLWDKDELIRYCSTKFALKRLQDIDSAYLATTLDSAVSALLTYDENSVGIIQSFRQRLISRYEDASRSCAEPAALRHRCEELREILGKSADGLRRLHGGADAEATAYFKEDLRKADDKSWRFRFAVDILTHLHAVDESIMSLAVRQAGTMEARRLALWINSVGDAQPLPAPQVGLPETLREPAKQTLLQALRSRSDDYALVRALRNLGLPNPEFVEWLHAQLTSQAGAARLDALETLLKFDIHDEPVIITALSILAQAQVLAERIPGRPALSCDPVAEELNGILRLLAVYPLHDERIRQQMTSMLKIGSILSAYNRNRETNLLQAAAMQGVNAQSLLAAIRDGVDIYTAARIFIASSTAGVRVIEADRAAIRSLLDRMPPPPNDCEVVRLAYNYHMAEYWDGEKLRRCMPALWLGSKLRKLFATPKGLEDAVSEMSSVLVSETDFVRRYDIYASAVDTFVAVAQEKVAEGAAGRQQMQSLYEQLADRRRRTKRTDQRLALATLSQRLEPLLSSLPQQPAQNRPPP